MTVDLRDTAEVLGVAMSDRDRVRWTRVLDCLSNEVGAELLIALEKAIKVNNVERVAHLGLYLATVNQCAAALEGLLGIEED